MIKKSVTIEKDMEKEDMPIAHLVQEASQYSSTVYFEVCLLYTSPSPRDCS